MRSIIYTFDMSIIIIVKILSFNIQFIKTDVSSN
jgi:hypothetical protein